VPEQSASQNDPVHCTGARAFSLGRASGLKGEEGNSVTTSQRLFFFDNLRVFAMAMVIAHHVGQAYGPTGGWWPIQEPARAEVLGAFFMVNRSFGMSLFFMIAGYFTVMSCDRYGPRAFVKNRLARLGIPTLVFGLVMIALHHSRVPRAGIPGPAAQAGGSAAG
jgi:peptidoglycan/LPS O-acetylase OafA/YrhL